MGVGLGLFLFAKKQASRWLTGCDAFKGVASTLRSGKCKQLAWPLISHHQEGSGPDNGTPFQLLLKVLFIFFVVRKTVRFVTWFAR